MAAGYANAAAMQMRVQPYPYGGAAMAPVPYGGAGYGGYGAAAAVPAANPTGRLSPTSLPPDATQQPYGGGDPSQQANYGAYRGQGAAQGRADRSYRPY